VNRVNEYLDDVLEEEGGNTELYLIFGDEWERTYEENRSFGLEARQNPQTHGNTLVDVFKSYIDDYDLYPPPEILRAMVEAFDTYFAAKGQLSLEEVFFGKTKKGIGNYAARRNSEVGGGLYGIFNIYKIMEAKDKTLSEAAESYLEREKMLHVALGIPFDMDVDTFLRGLRRWSKKMEEKRSQNNADVADK